MPSSTGPVVATDGDAGATYMPRGPHATRMRPPTRTGSPSHCISSSVIPHLKRGGARADAAFVIELHRLHGNGTIVVNADLVETVEATPDTVITMVTKRRFVVEDSVADVIDRVVAYRARIGAAIGAGGTGDTTDSTSASRAVIAIQHEEQAA